MFKRLAMPAPKMRLSSGSEQRRPMSFDDGEGEAVALTGGATALEVVLPVEDADISVVVIEVVEDTSVGELLETLL